MTTFAKKLRRYSMKAKRTAASPSDEALVEVMCLAACVDGRLEDGEAVSLAGQIMATPGFAHLGAEQLAKLVKEKVARLEKEGLEKRVKAIAAALAGDQKAREEAFALATLFALYDGEVGDEEQALLDSLQKALRISDECAARLSALLAEG